MAAAQLLSNALLPSSRTVALARTCPPRATSKRGGREEEEEEEEEEEGFLIELALEGRILERVPTPINWKRRRGTGERAVILLTCTMCFPACSEGGREKAASSFLARDGGESLCTVSRWKKKFGQSRKRPFTFILICGTPLK